MGGGGLILSADTKNLQFIRSKAWPTLLQVQRCMDGHNTSLPKSPPSALRYLWLALDDLVMPLLYMTKR